jgi:hypothetical protein
MRGHNRVKHFYICFNGEISRNDGAKKVQIYMYLQSDLLQSQVINVTVPKRLRAVLHVFIWEILASMIQVSDVAPWSLVLS